jgi:hypothetical protein
MSSPYNFSGSIGGTLFKCLGPTLTVTSYCLHIFVVLVFLSLSIVYSRIYVMRNLILDMSIFIYSYRFSIGQRESQGNNISQPTTH